MSRQDILRALDPCKSYERAISAEKREHPRQAPAPVVLHVEVSYKQWDGPRLPWREDFGKGRGQVYSRDGTAPQRSCNEVEVARQLGGVRRHAHWISSYSPAGARDLARVGTCPA